ncbi:ATP-grasp domain-containing protein [Vibrio tubiashii]|nr:hypothetical protein VITU9109_17363 [Vibrio tubiashii ATCC 19109]
MTKINGWVLIIGGKSELVYKAHRLGLQVVRLIDRSPTDVKEIDLAEHVVTADFNDEKMVINIACALNQVFHFKQAISLSEDMLVISAKVREALCLPGVSVEVAMLLKDKALMRAHLAKSNFPSILWKFCTNSDHVIEFIKENRLSKVILKPVCGAGSEGVRVICKGDSVPTVVADILSKGWKEFLVEEFLEGEEISVEAFSFNGKHQILATTKKTITAGCIERGHVLPYQPDGLDDIEAFVMEFLNTVGLKDGPSHTELKLTSTGPQIIESHNRVGGDHINELLNQVYKVDPKEVAISYACGMQETSPFYNPQGYAAIRYAIVPAGKLSSNPKVAISERKSVQLLDSRLVFEVGQIIPPLSDSSARAGFVIAAGDNYEYLDQTMSHWLESVEKAVAEAMES